MNEYLIRLANIQSNFVHTLRAWNADYTKPNDYLKNQAYREETKNLPLCNELCLTERNGLQMFSENT